MSGTGWPSESRVQHPNYYIRMPTCYRSGVSATSLKDVDTGVCTTPKILIQLLHTANHSQRQLYVCVFITLFFDFFVVCVFLNS